MSSKTGGFFDRGLGFGSEKGVLNQKPTSYGVGSGKAISATLDDIEFYTLNPRKTDNPEYEAIKESIREIGLENPLTLTKRPGDASYTLYNGGNTRLKALKELWQETNDERYYYQDCRFMPWPEHGDLDVLMKHMIENETRGDMLLIDKANAAYKIKQLHEDETGQKIGLRPLELLLKAKGWSVGFSTLGVYIFASEKLANKIPFAFKNGLGKPKVKEIRKIYNAIEKYIKEKLPELNIEEMQELYLDNLANYDSEEGLGDDYALRDTCRHIGEQVNIEGPRVQFEIDHILRHGTAYDKGSTSSDYNDLGQYIGEETPSSETGNDDGEGNSTGTEHNGQAVGGETSTTETGNAKTKTTAPVLSKKAKHQAMLLEQGYQIRNKIKAILCKHEFLSKYIQDDENFPFFVTSDAEMLMLRADIKEQSDNWDNNTVAVVAEFVTLATSYFYARIESHPQMDIPDAIKDLDVKALETCTTSLKEEVDESSVQLNAIRNGLIYQEVFDPVLDIQDDFHHLRMLLRDYQRAYVQLQNIED